MNSSQYKDQWQKDNKDRIVIIAHKGLKAQVQEAAKVKGISVTKWIESAIEAKLLEEEFD